jgi:hypothetical protein
MDPNAEADKIRSAIQLAERDGVKLRTYDDPGAQIRLPAAMVFAPEIDFETSFEPSGGTYPVVLVVKQAANSLSELLAWLPVLVESIEENVTNAVVRGPALPAVADINGDNLPAYMLTVEVGSD